MMNCKEATKKIELREEGKLNWKERMQLRMHLLICTYCRRFEQHLQKIRRLIDEGQYAEVRLTSEQKNQIKQQLKEQN